MANKETKQFDAEIGKVLNLMINSLYTNKEIFLRELISNSSDACDKLRYLSQTDPKLNENHEDAKITIAIDKDNLNLIITDNGIGMDKNDLIENLGRIASSGTQRFMEQLSGDAKKDSLLIGQFGVGFYSTYMVAELVTVKSRKAGTEQTHIWQSNGQGEYTIEEAKNEFTRGTEITLHLKEDQGEFLDKFRVEHIVKNYSDHISIPIFLIDDEVENNDSKEDENTKAKSNLRQINSSSALWTRSKSEISEDQYNEFYKSVAFAADNPWLTLHNRNEGVVEFTNLLYVPTNKTFDLFHPDRKRRVKLYIKRVFITDENIDLVPHYLRFIRGVVDSEDLPLNVSRETLQHNAVIEKIKNSITKRVLSELAKKLENDREGFEKFWNNFGAAIKEGLCEPIAEKDKILDICLFRSALKDKLITLKEYIAEMGENQKEIYYVSGDDFEKLKNNPKIEGFLKRNIDVLLFTDSVDDFWTNVSGEYEGKQIKSVTRASIDLNDSASKTEEEKSASKTEENTDLFSYCKEVLGEKIKEARFTTKLSTSASCLAVDENAMDIRMERFLIEQNQLPKATAKILELNPNHAITKNIIAAIENNNKNEQIADLVKLLFDQACILEGEPIEDVNGFTQRFNSFISKNLAA